ncbi:homoserine kinase [Alicyclobacillus tolerans]|uniref:Homoserine kinase n=2 Tax=Alicyclobacillus tolerans TaxID=90970 RepID=A0ABT9LTC9_9BACL|nr:MULTISPECIES: homoserine kinase [Alicyclobacillus]MDP9727522.1 homoserine kinase [Alicyclobacillus tengchongensis]SHJ68344.1 homoserine kinase [Alicyclobacillus montanus]
MRRWTVCVPATTANLGPGFDCLGLAFQMYNQVILSESDSFSITIGGEVRQALPNSRENVVVQAMDKLFRYAGYAHLAEGFSLHIDCSIPIASGLGSSAAAVVSGLLLANAWLERHSVEPLSKQKLLELATEMEGHPDNVAPALFGGSILSWWDDLGLRHLRVPVPDTLRFVAAIPYFPLLTEKARQVVPLTYSRQDVIFNVAQTARLILSLSTNRLEFLRGGFADKIHEPYRQKLIPGYAEVKKAALQAGALTTTLSGAGPTLLAWCLTSADAQEVADQMTMTWQNLGISCVAHILYPELDAPVVQMEKGE